MTTDYKDNPLFGLDGLINDDKPRARRNDPEPSHAGADATDLAARRILMDDIYGRLLLHPSTDAELRDWYFSINPDSPLDRDSVRKRRSDLAALGKVQATPLRRDGGSGIKVTVWAAALPTWDDAA